MPVRFSVSRSRVVSGRCGSRSRNPGSRRFSVARLRAVARRSAVAALAALGGCTGALALDAAELDATDIPGGPVTQSEPAPTAAPRRRRIPSVEDYAAVIVSRSIFDSTRVGAEEEVAERELTWILLGTVAASAPENSSALLAPRDGSALARPFAIGDELEPGAYLDAIARGKIRVRFVEGGGMELGFASAEERLAQRVRASAGGEEVVKQTEPGKWSVSVAVLARVSKDADKAVETASARAYDRKGVEGVRLGRVRRGAVLYKLGLRSGDVLSGVDGRTVHTPDELAGALGSAARSGNFTVELTRRRKEKTFSYAAL